MSMNRSEMVNKSTQQKNININTIHNNLRYTKVINNVEPFTQENINNVPKNRLIILHTKDKNSYGFDIDALNTYLSKESNHPKNPFTMEPFSKGNMKEIQGFNRKGNHHIPEREHFIWKIVENLGDEIQCKLSLEEYKKYEKIMETIKKNWKEFRQNSPDNDVKKEVNHYFIARIQTEMKKVRRNIFYGSTRNIRNDNYNLIIEDEIEESSTDDDSSDSLTESESVFEGNEINHFNFQTSGGGRFLQTFESYTSHRYHPYNGTSFYMDDNNNISTRRISSRNFSQMGRIHTYHRNNKNMEITFYT